jgi:hypothetical protein
MEGLKGRSKHFKCFLKGHRVLLLHAQLRLTELSQMNAPWGLGSDFRI